MSETNYTPMMKQYIDTKKKYPEGILLFRAGDFYEMFYDDAKEAANLLNITLTKRGKGPTQAPLAGIPYHSIDPYISKLVKLGKKVVICEQIEDPRFAKGLVKRAVTRIITPSTLFSDNYENNFLCSIAYFKGNYGFSLTDITTDDFKSTVFNNFETILNELSLIKPKELLITKNILKNIDLINNIKKTIPNTIINYTDNIDLEISSNKLKEHFNTKSLSIFGLDESFSPSSIISSYNALNYLKETQFSELKYITRIKEYSLNKYLKLDAKTVRNLELVSNLKDNTVKNSLFYHINNTKTAMGYRKLYFDILHPILDKKKLININNSVLEIIEDTALLQELSTQLSYIGDIERIISKVGFGNVNPRDLINLKQSLSILPKIKLILKNTKSENLRFIYESLNTLEDLYNIINNSIVEEPPFSVREGKYIKSSFSKELYEIININKTINSWIVEFENKLKNETKIKSLKVNFNKIFGYYIEVPKSQSKEVPDYFDRKQTLVNTERYTTKELSEKENILLHSNEKRIDLEYSIFLDICKKVLSFKEDVLKVSHLISKLDVYLCFAITSSNNDYYKPKLTNTNKLYFKDLRHPIIEKLVEFIPNDCNLDETTKTMIITGPNMSGKSSYMRSVCLSIILGHIGCFIPSTESEIGFIDGVFTRVGASDDIIHGQSTFLVEMSEISYILNNCTKDSFVILDEVGRGTSTYDGISLAWSIIEYLNNKVNCKTLVATHYHLLNKMEENFKGIKNFHVTAKEEESTLLFLHKLREGGINKSYGIQVAKIAGLPSDLILNALKIQKELEEEVFLKKENSKDDSRVLFKKEQKKIFDYKI